MSALLMKDVFDNFWMLEAEVRMGSRITLDGRLNLDFFTQEELEQLAGREYVKWEEMRPLLFQIMKGSKLPISFHLVLLLSRENTSRVLERSGADLLTDEVRGLFINIKYEKERLILTTGIGLSIFTLDKTLEQEWDANIKAFLKKKDIIFEEL